MTKVNLVQSRLLLTNSLRHLAARSLGHRVMAAVMVFVAFLVLLVAPGIAPAQQAPLHLNPAVEKLAHGQSIIGTQTDDMSLRDSRRTGETSKVMTGSSSRRWTWA